MVKRNGSRSEGARPYPKSVLYASGPQRSFTGLHLDQIAFPLGGIGAGSINLGGSGNLVDFSIFNRPNLGGQPMAFATITAKQAGKAAVARVIEGPVTHSRVYQGGQHARGANVGHEGLPHMASAVFRGEFPFAWIEFAEPDLPLKVSLEGWSPFIPLDDHNSSIPAAVLTYRFANRSRRPVQATFAFHLAHMIFASEADGVKGCGIEARRAKSARGLLYHNTSIHPEHPKYATFALATPHPKAVLKAGWFRGGWFDSRSMLWREIEAGRFQPSSRSKPVSGPPRRHTPGGTLAIALRLKPGERRSASVILAWHSPRCEIRFGWPDQPEPPEWESGTSQPAAPDDPRVWRPYYAGRWKDAWAVAQYMAQHLDELERRSRRFHDVFFSTSAPPYALDAVSANLGILKSPTCLRLEDGTLWAYEGCLTNAGCCPGSCTHVWNYAQAVPHLFPPLERSLRSLELERSMSEEGHVRFRTPLPPTSPDHNFPAAADGQLGGIMKVYRDWQISGDEGWLRRMFPLARRSLEYCIRTWDPERRGAVFEAHHNTYDIEFYGPDAMCASFYLGALRATAEMAEHLGEADYAAQLRALADKGLLYCDRELFNGEYYHQKIMSEGLRKNYWESGGLNQRYSPEALALAKKEGPKYQYGSGCLADGVIGQWFATLFGLPDALNRGRTRSSLQSIFRYNFRDNLRRHVNPQRATYALNDEAGLLLCTWPKGGRLSLPFVYSDEVWTGIEYQAASHLIYEGFVDEGLTIVKAARDRYDGLRRNPWNEYECGSYYARAMSSYAILTALTGFRYSAARKEAVLDPRLNDRRIVSFFSTAKGWGRFVLKRKKGGAASVRFEVEEGRLPIRALRLPAPSRGAKEVSVAVGGAKAKARVEIADGFANVRLSSAAAARPGAPLTISIG